MIDLFFMTSPNVYKICIALEEIGAEYRLIPTDIAVPGNLTSERLGGAINGKVPVIIDRDPSLDEPRTVFESGAILLYLSEKHGRLLPADSHGRMEALQWLFWQVGGLGPFGGQCFHFRALAPILAPDTINDYSRGRYEKIYRELCTVLEKRLSTVPFLAGEYSVADIACYPWVAYLPPEGGWEDYPRVCVWRDTIARRPAVGRAYERSRQVDMGLARNELDTVTYTAEQLRMVVTL